MGVKMKNADSNKTRITGNMTIGDVVAKYPAAIEVLLANGIHCVGCHVQYFETLEQGLKGHGMTDEQVNFVMLKLNEAVEGDEAPGEEGKDFVITKKAAEKLQELFKKEKKESYSLRIGVIPGGCSGYSYELDFEKEAKGTDIVLEEKGVKILIDSESLKMIKGAKMDFIDTLQGSGFKITNPNAVDSCGCGQSFRQT